MVSVVSEEKNIREIVMKHILIIGGDGLIGRFLRKTLMDKGFSVLATTRHMENITDVDRQIFLDLAKPFVELSLPFIPDAVIFSAAVTNREICEREPEASQWVNVAQAVNYLGYFLAKKIYCIFLSTNMVLGGGKPFLPVEASYAPTDAYSSQKTIAETQLQELPNADTGLAILRLTKVLSQDTGVIRDWVAKGKRGEAIQAFQDCNLSPIHPLDVSQMVAQMLMQQASGVYHLSCKEEIDYYRFAKEIFASLGLDERLIQAVEGRKTNEAARLSPPYNSLDVSRSEAMFEIACPRIANIVRHITAEFSSSRPFNQMV